MSKNGVEVRGDTTTITVQAAPTTWVQVAGALFVAGAVLGAILAKAK